MPLQNNSASAQLLKLEKLARRVIRKSLKDNTLDYTVQISVSSLEPTLIKYSCQITAPAQGVQPITFICNSFKELTASLELAAQELNRQKVEIAFHENRINTFKQRITQHQERVDELNSPDYDPSLEEGMEEVSVGEETPDEAQVS